MIPLWTFVALLAVHWVADFVCQTHWQASNKSKNNEALAAHVTVYSGIVLIAALALFARDVRTIVLVFGFTGLNGILHFCTDYCTSRWSAKWFALAVKAMKEQWACELRYWPSSVQMPSAGQYFHNFFAVVGFDQLIHQVTFAVLVSLFFFYF